MRRFASRLRWLEQHTSLRGQYACTQRDSDCVHAVNHLHLIGRSSWLCHVNSLHTPACLSPCTQVDETKAVQALGPEAALSQGSIEAALAVAKAQLAEGKLVAAVSVVLSHCVCKTSVLDSLTSQEEQGSH